MPANPAAFVAFDGDDDDFGDFKFVSYPSPSASASASASAGPGPPQPPLAGVPHRPPPAAAAEEDDDWGDFVASPLGSQPLDPPTPSPVDPATPSSSGSRASGSKAWERPRGALPLSIFGDEEVEEADSLEVPSFIGGNGFSTSSSFSSSSKSLVAKDGNGSAKGGDLKDLIVNLYGQAAPVGAGGSEKVGSDSGRGDGGGGELDESGSEFRDAFSPDAGSKISGIEKNAAANGSRIGVIRNRLEDSKEANGHLGVSNGERDLGGLHPQHDGFTSGLDFGSKAVSRSNSVSDGYQQNGYTQNGNGLHTNQENVNDSVDVESWEFMGAFSEYEAVMAPSGQKTIPDIKMEEFTNGWDLGSKAVSCTNSISDGYQQNGYMQNENRLHANQENGNESLDDDRWEFKGAFSENEAVTASSGEKQLRIPAIKVEEFTNVLDFGSKAVSRTNSISDGYQQNGYTQNENRLHANQENGNESLDDERWEFKGAFSENEAVTVSSGQKTIPDIKAEEFTHINGTQGTRNMWDNDVVDCPISMKKNMEDDTGECYTDQNEISFEPTFMENGVEDLGYSSILGLNDSILNLYNKADQTNGVHPATIPMENGTAEFGSCAITGSDGGDQEIQWEFKMAAETAGSNQNSAVGVDQNLSFELGHKTVPDLYHRLREESLFLAVNHLDDLKKAHEAAALAGEQAKVTKINEEIQEAYKTLQETKVNEDAYIGKQPAIDVLVSQLLKDIEEPKFRALEQEYRISEKLLSAGKHLSGAIELLEHTNSILHILELVSKEEQNSYVNRWSNMALACAQELQHGAMIWEESLRANVSTQILSQGGRYFVSLGEIYRVTEILRASVKFYKPWILVHQGNMKDVLTCLEKCVETWFTSGLDKALESISNTVDAEHADLAKELLRSIKHTHDLDELFVQKHAVGSEEKVCKICLLPITMLQDLKVVIWNGEHYYLKLANFWANRISRDPPQFSVASVG